jgi:guanylate kinase
MIKQIIILSGPSCVGKGPLLRALRRYHPELLFGELTLCTTRAPRFKMDRNAWEIHGIDYYFMPREWFEHLDPGRFLVAPIRSELQAIDLEILEIKLAHHNRIIAEIHPRLARMLIQWIKGQSRWKIDMQTVSLVPMSLGEIEQKSSVSGKLPVDVVAEVMHEKLKKRSEDPPEKIAERAVAAYDEIIESAGYQHQIVNHAGEDALDQWADPLAVEPKRVLEEFAAIICGSYQ